jgi:hypothetical protein
MAADGAANVHQTCRRLHALAFSKHVWVELLEYLNTRLFLPPGQCLRELSAAELIALAKRIAQGPQTWSPSHPSQPVLTRQHVLHPQIRLRAGVFQWEREAKLLPGGRHVLLNNRGVLECWDVAEDRLTWKYETSLTGSLCEFAAEVVDNDQAAVIIIGWRVYYSLQRKEKCVHVSFQSDSSDVCSHIVVLWRLCT